MGLCTAVLLFWRRIYNFIFNSILSDQYDSEPVRLFQMRGKKSPTCVQCAVAWSSFGSDSIMLLQTGRYIFVWIGRASSASERINGLRLAGQLRELYGLVGHEMATVDDGYEQSMGAERKCDWNQYLSLLKRHVQPVVLVPVDALPAATFKLYKCGFSNGKYRIEEVKSAHLQQTDLNDATAAFIIDCGWRGVWIWLGRNCMVKDKAEAMRNARGFVKKVCFILSIIFILMFPCICLIHRRCRWLPAHRHRYHHCRRHHLHRLHRNICLLHLVLVG